ncbi:MAG TPA: MarR family transcriptional regulator [Humibacillus sp.]|nr:MarR family transcriptional regulator [Humibacillus sp.]
MTEPHPAERTTPSARADGSGADGSGPDDLLRLDQQVCFALAVAARNVIGLYRPVLEPMGLTHPQYLVMLALWEHAPLTLKEIGELLSLEPATVSPLVKRLESAGLVVRERHPHDDRALHVRLTSQGADLRAQALLVPPQIIARLGMEVEQLQELHASLTRVIAASRQADEDGAGA